MVTVKFRVNVDPQRDVGSITILVNERKAKELKFADIKTNKFLFVFLCFFLSLEMITTLMFWHNIGSNLRLTQSITCKYFEPTVLNCLSLLLLY